MHFAICIWGLLRSSIFTIPSFQKYILKSLRMQHHTYDIIMHTYAFHGRYSNFRSGENNIQLNFSHWKLYKPNYIYIEDQDRFDANINYPLYQIQGDPWRNNYNSFYNELRALNSLFHVGSVIESIQLKHPTYFDAIIYLRPDVLFLHSLPIISIQWILESSRYFQCLLVPDFHRSCFGGQVNDRFAIGGVKAGLIYGKRLEHALQYSQIHTLHSENYLSAVLKMKNIDVIEAPIRFKRVRSNGKIEERDRSIKSPQVQRIQDEEIKFLLFNLPGLSSVTQWFFQIVSYPWLIGLRLVEGYAFNCHPFPHISIQNDLIPQISTQNIFELKKIKIQCNYRNHHLFLQSSKASIVQIPYNCTLEM